MVQYGSIPGVTKPVSRTIHGTIMANSKDLEGSFALLDAVLESGVNTFDTAHVYGSGDNERTVGQWFNDRGVRDQIVILGKGSHHNSDRKRVTPFDITADIHDSLARFKTEKIDLYVLHRDDPSQPVGPIIEVLNEHKAAGRIDAFGGSNWSVERLIAANEYAEQQGLTPFVASSPNFSLADQVREPWPDCVTISGPGRGDDRAWYQANQMPLLTWSSMAGGFFSGRFKRDNLDSFDAYFDKVVVDSYCSEENFQRLDRAQQMADEKGLTVAQVAIAFVMSQPLNIYALLAPRTAEEIRLNNEAAEIKLTQAEMDWLDLKAEAVV